MKFICGIVGALLFISSNLSAVEPTPSKPYKITVWADVLYDTSGHATRINFPAKDKYPIKFIQNLQYKLEMTKIEPPVENDLPATFETGVRIDITVTPSPSGASVKIDAMREEPLIVKKAMDKYPPELIAINWTGTVKIKCLVGLNGKCNSLEILDSENLPDPVRRFALGSMKAWRFKLQRVNGKPLPYELIVPFKLIFDDPYPADFIGRF